MFGFLFLALFATACWNDFPNVKQYFSKVKKFHFKNVKWNKAKKCAFYVFCHRTRRRSLSLLKIETTRSVWNVWTTFDRNLSCFRFAFLLRSAHIWTLRNIKHNCLYRGRFRLDVPARYLKTFCAECWFSLTQHESCATIEIHRDTMKFLVLSTSHLRESIQLVSLCFY